MDLQFKIENEKKEKLLIFHDNIYFFKDLGQ